MGSGPRSRLVRSLGGVLRHSTFGRATGSSSMCAGSTPAKTSTRSARSLTHRPGLTGIERTLDLIEGSWRWTAREWIDGSSRLVGLCVALGVVTSTPAAAEAYGEGGQSTVSTSGTQTSTGAQATVEGRQSVIPTSGNTAHRGRGTATTRLHIPFHRRRQPARRRRPRGRPALPSRGHTDVAQLLRPRHRRPRLGADPRDVDRPERRVRREPRRPTRRRGTRQHRHRPPDPAHLSAQPDVPQLRHLVLDRPAGEANRVGFRGGCHRHRDGHPDHDQLPDRTGSWPSVAR